jgi:drug/metabolite transporter (DMT)-like permease
MIYAKILSGVLDIWTQNFYRYFSAMAVLLLFSARHREGRSFPRPGRWWVFLIPAIFNVIHQVAWVFPLYYKDFNPGYANLLQKTSPIFGAVLGYLFFADERSHIRSLRFLTGLFGGFLGAAGVILAQGKVVDGHFQGSVLIILSSICWALYTVGIRKVMGRTDPISAFTVVSVLTAAALGIFAWAFGNPGAILSVSPSMALLVIFSGVTSIGIGHPLYFYAVRDLGVAVCTAILLANVITTALASFFIFGEILTIQQILWAVLLVVGAWLTIPKR